MKIIDGKGATLGRLASYVAKEALKGEEIRVLNCEEILITGNKQGIKEDFEQKRRNVGSTQKGPKHSRNIDKIVKRTIRGMLPEHREGRGKLAYKRIRCYIGVPKEFENSKMEKMEKRKETISHKIGEIIR
jgi:large subunit ribosomal protein L13